MTSIQSTSLPFSDIDRTTYEALIERFSDPKEKEPIHFPWYEVIAHIPGTLFLISHDGLPIACALCYGGQRFDARHLPAISNSHEFWFARELNVIGNFCFIKFIIVHRDHRQKGFAKELVRIIEEHFSSHSTTNIGSHVLANLFSDEETALPSSPEENFQVQDLEQFNNYLRTRMDFLADISTSVPVASSTHNLGTEVLQKFHGQEIINRYISGTQLRSIELDFENKINPGQDLPVQISNGTIGYHALYVILENIIRNCAKHDYQLTAQVRSLKITVSAEALSHDQQYYRIRIMDHLPRKRKSSLKHLAKKLNQDFIYPPLFDKDLEIRPVGWGLLEMKIAAAYLRKIPPIHIDKKFDHPLLKAIEIPAEDGCFNLGYELYMRKPAEALILDGSIQPVCTHITITNLSKAPPPLAS